jgi:hypothetical protein
VMWGNQSTLLFTLSMFHHKIRCLKLEGNKNSVIFYFFRSWIFLAVLWRRIVSFEMYFLSVKIFIFCKTKQKKINSAWESGFLFPILGCSQILGVSGSRNLQFTVIYLFAVKLFFMKK